MPPMFIITLENTASTGNVNSIFFNYLLSIFLIHYFNFFRMITCQEKALENMKMGLYDVLPAGSLDGLTAEDFRLLLNGVKNFKYFLVKFKIFFF